MLKAKTKGDLEAEAKRLRSRRDKHRNNCANLTTKLKHIQTEYDFCQTKLNNAILYRNVFGVFAVLLAIWIGQLLNNKTVNSVTQELLVDKNNQIVHAYGKTKIGPSHMLASVRLGWGGGSATIISSGSDGALGLSVWHCFSNQYPGYKFKVLLPYKSQSLSCTLIATSYKYDLALFSIEDPNNNIRFTCPVLNTPSPPVSACGYPGGVGPNVKWVSSNGHNTVWTNTTDRWSGYRHQYWVKSGIFAGGDSGGGVCDSDGYLVGVITHGIGKDLRAAPHENIYKFLLSQEPKLKTMKKRKRGKWYRDCDKCVPGNRPDDNYQDDTTPAPAPPWRKPNETLPDKDLKKDKDRRKAISDLRKQLKELESNINSNDQIAPPPPPLPPEIVPPIPSVPISTKPTKGDKGDRGKDGDRGDKGDKGKDGDKGDKGDKGDRGKDGDSFDSEKLNELLVPVSDRINTIENKLNNTQPPLTVEEIADAVKPSIKIINDRVDVLEERIIGVESNTQVIVPGLQPGGKPTQIQTDSGVSHYVLVYDSDNTRQLAAINQYLISARKIHPYIMIVPTAQIPFIVLPTPQIVTYDLNGRSVQIDRGLYETQSMLIRIANKDF